MKKFNEFELWFMTNAIHAFIEQAENDVKAAEADGHQSLFAPGYFTMVGKELLDKVESMTKRKTKRNA
jgi:hypothetical protein